MRRWYPLFTREYPLYIADMAVDAYVRLMEREVGWGYRDALITGEKGLITAHYSEDDARRFRRFCRGQPPRFFSQRNALIRQRAHELVSAVRRFRRRLQTEGLTAAFEDIHAAYQRLYAVYRFSPMVDLAARVKAKGILHDCAQTKELAGRAIKNADRVALPLLGKEINGLSGVPASLALNLRTREIRRLMATGQLPVSTAELRRRFKRFVYRAVNQRSVVYVGARAAKVTARLNIIRQWKIRDRVVAGQAAYRGNARGDVVVVRRAFDLSKVHAGCIFVAPMTLPTQTPWVKKAAAIVTDEGGITCHAAIVSRELGIPCVIGTKIATQVLKDGDVVEVDATQGIVRKL